MVQRGLRHDGLLPRARLRRIPGGRLLTGVRPHRRPLPPAGEPTEPGGEILHWHVDDLPAAFDRLLALGAKEFQAPREHGPGFVTASVVDPFGNILGVMFNQHYLDMYAEIRGA